MDQGLVALLVITGTVCLAGGFLLGVVWAVMPRDDVERMAHEDQRWAERLARVADRRLS